jgi:hypothetical protein
VGSLQTVFDENVCGWHFLVLAELQAFLGVVCVARQQRNVSHVQGSLFCSRCTNLKAALMQFYA